MSSYQNEIVQYLSPYQTSYLSHPEDQIFSPDQWNLVLDHFYKQISENEEEIKVFYW